MVEVVLGILALGGKRVEVAGVGSQVEGVDFRCLVAVGFGCQVVAGLHFLAVVGSGLGLEMDKETERESRHRNLWESQQGQHRRVMRE